MGIRRGQGRRGRRVGAWALVVGLWAYAHDARAGEVRLRSQTFGEGYVLLTAGPGGVVVPRRRLVQYVHIGVHGLLPPTDPRTLRRDPEDGQLRWVSSLRIRHDFGGYLQAPTSSAQRLVDRIDGRQVDLMFAYLEGERLGGYVDTRIGRQLSTTGLDFFAFDGAWARVRTPSALAVTVFGGTMVRGADALGYVTYELDGTDTSRRTQVASPTFGGELSILGRPRFTAAVGYRQTLETRGRADVPDVGGPVTLESLLSARFEIRDRKQRARLSGGLRYDVGVATVSDARLAGEVRMFGWQTLRVGYARTHPIFSLDSIFNVFERSVVEEGRAAWEVRLGPAVALETFGSLRLFRDTLQSREAGGSGGPAPLRATSQGGGVAVSLRTPRVWAGVRGQGLSGRGGSSVSGLLYGGTSVLWDRLRLDGRLFANHVRQDEALVGGFAGQGWNAAAQLTARARLFQGIHLSWLHEPGVSSQMRWQYRTMAVLSVDWTTRGGLR